MRPSKSDGTGVLSLSSLFDRRRQDYKSLELSLEAGDLSRARRALERCRQDNREIAAATGISDSSAVGLIGATLLRSDLTVLTKAFQTGEIPPELSPPTAQQWYRRALLDNRRDSRQEDAMFIRDLFTALQTQAPTATSEKEAGAGQAEDRRRGDAKPENASRGASNVYRLFGGKRG
jgi:hypothetical protein